MTEAKNAFQETLAELRQGETLRELHQALTQLVGDVRSVGKPGKLTLTVTVTMAKGSTSTLVVTDELKITEPKADKEITILYADDANRLSRRDPRQPKLPDMGEVRSFRPTAVNASTGEIPEP